MHWIIRLGLSIAFFGAIVYADRRERRLLLFLLFGAVLALWVFGLLGLFGLPPASLYLSGVVGISLGFVIRSLARWKRKRTLNAVLAKTRNVSLLVLNS